MAGKSVDVLVIGGGPVGLALALDLGLRGVATMLVERRDGVIRMPKMGYVNPRTMEFCRRWGVAAEIKRHGYPAHLPLSVFWLTSLTGKKIGGFEYPSYDELGVLRHTPEGGRRCSQLYFDPILLERLRREPTVAVRLQTMLEEVTDAGDHVRATLRNADGTVEAVTARYAVACDGDESPVRESVGLRMHGSAGEVHCTNVIFRTPNLWRFLRHGPAAFNWLVGPEGQWANVIPVDGDTLWRLALWVGDPRNPLTPEAVGRLIQRAAGAEIDFEIQSIMPWSRRDRIAESFRRGRIFLAGDAAHIMPPTGGLGMNSGVGDAMDLSWKFAAVLEGWGEAGLLDAYDAERRPIAIVNTEEAKENARKLDTLPAGREIADDTDDGATLRRRMREVIETGGYRAEYEQEATVLGYRYRGSPLVVEGDGQSDRSPTTNVPTSLAHYVQPAAPGGRAPHAWLRDGGSTLDHFWNGFTIVKTRAGGGDPAPLLAAASRRRVPMTFVDFSDEPEVGEIYDGNFALVRPDGLMVWQGDTPPAGDAAAAALVETIRGARA